MTGTWDSAPRPLNVSPPANGSSCGRPGGNFDDKGCQGSMVSLMKSLQKEILIHRDWCAWNKSAGLAVPKK